MAQIIFEKDGKRVFVAEFAEAKRFTVNDKPYRSRNSEWALRAAKMLRDSGVSSARAITDKGEPLESESALAGEAAAPTEDTRPASFRGVTPEKIGSKYFVKWHDELTNQNYSISGNTPQLCLENLFGNEHPIVVRYRDTLPPEDEVQTQTATPIPKPNPRAPAANRVLRPGDGYLAGHAIPERRIQSETPSAHREFAAWEQSASVLQLKERIKTDAAFAQWYGQQQQAVAVQPKGVF
jgi:hypothetical protein